MERQISNGVKKILVLAVFISAILIMPNFGKAQTNVDANIQKINKLTNEILSVNKVSAKKYISKKAEAAKKRKILMLELAKKDPSSFLSVVISAKKRSVLPKEVQKEIEEEIISEGVTEVMHIDDFENYKNSKFIYYLNLKGKRFNFYPTKQINVISGMKVKVKAFKLENSFVSESSAQTIQVLETPVLDSTGDQKTLVFLVRFLDSTAAPFTKEQAYDLVFNDQFQAFMKEQSYGKVSFSGFVSDWITLNKNKNTSTLYDRNVYTEEIQKYIINNNIDLSNYSRVLFLTDGFGGGGSEIGKVNVRFNGQNYRLSTSWVGALPYNFLYDRFPFKWAFLDATLSHELGHALGVAHANALDCGEKTLSDNCTHIEYGNAFDVMGSGSYSVHFNGFYKERLGWINSEEILSIDKSGTYSIASLETNKDKNVGPKIAKIEIKTSNGITLPFYLEHRAALGFDAKLNDFDLSSNQEGLFINKIVDDLFPYPQILDARPTTQDFYDDLKQATLNSPESFNDSKTGVTIKNVKTLENKLISFDVEIGVTTSTSSLTVLSPNGGEQWAFGSNQIIKWIAPYNGFQSGILLIDANNTSRSWRLLERGDFAGENSFTWNVGQGAPFTNTTIAPSVGSYYIKICQNLGSLNYQNCDFSNTPFSIVAASGGGGGSGGGSSTTTTISQTSTLDQMANTLESMRDIVSKMLKSMKRR